MDSKSSKSNYSESTQVHVHTQRSVCGSEGRRADLTYSIFIHASSGALMYAICVAKMVTNGLYAISGCRARDVCTVMPSGKSKLQRSVSGSESEISGEIKEEVD